MISTILTTLSNYYDHHVERAKKRHFNAGYDWAAGCLLRGEAPINVYGKVSMDWEGDHPFDNGVYRAVADWEKLKGKRDADKK